MAKTYDQILAEEKDLFQREQEKRAIDNTVRDIEKQNSISESSMPFDQQVDLLIAERGPSSFSDIVDQFKKPGLINKGLSVLEMSDFPRQRAEAAIANPMLALQRGAPLLEPKFLVDEFISGAKGGKQGQLGDVMRGAGAPEAVAAPVGFAAMLISPLAALKTIKNFAPVAKFSDKGLRMAGNQLVKASDDAVSIIGKELDSVYKPINSIMGDSNKFLNSISNLPKVLLDEIAERMGSSIEDILMKPTISNMRKVKGIIGDYRPGAFGKKVKGLSDNIVDRKINSSYSKVKKLMQETLEGKKLGKEASRVLEADDAFTEVSRASSFVKRNITESSLLKPTKASRAAKALRSPDNLSMRDALTTLKFAGKSARKNVIKAIDALDRYNRGLFLGGVGKKGLKAAVYTGVVSSLLKSKGGQSFKDFVSD